MPHTTHSTNLEDTTEGGIGPAATPGAHTSVIRSVSIRVAGPVTTEAFAHHFGTEAEQVGVRAGDTLSYVTGHEVAETIGRAFSDAVATAEHHELRYTVSATWLGVAPGTYPPTLMQRHTTVPATGVGFQPRRAIPGSVVPAHVWVRVGPVLWRVCDRVAADRLAHVWSSCARMLSTQAPVPAIPQPRSEQHTPHRMGASVDSSSTGPRRRRRPVRAAGGTASPPALPSRPVGRLGRPAGGFDGQGFPAAGVGGALPAAPAGAAHSPSQRLTVTVSILFRVGIAL